MTNKKDRSKTTKEKVEDFIKEAKKHGNITDVIDKDLKNRSKEAQQWYRWLTDEVNTSKKIKPKDAEKFTKDAIVLSSVFEAMIEATNRLALPYKEGITSAFKRQLSMIMATMVLKDKYPIQAKRSLYMIQQTPVNAFVLPLDNEKQEELKNVVDNLFSKEVTKDKSENKTYI